MLQHENRNNQCLVLYIIKSQERYTLTRDEIKIRLVAFYDMHDYVVIIYQVVDLVKKIKHLFRQVLYFMGRTLKMEPVKKQGFSLEILNFRFRFAANQAF